MNIHEEKGLNKTQVSNSGLLDPLVFGLTVDASQAYIVCSRKVECSFYSIWT